MHLCRRPNYFEISRRIGMATRDFKALARIWNRSGLSRSRKVHIFEACVLSRLAYALEAAWLPVACRRRLDGFHARCLRKILRIPPPHMSFISNATVRKIARVQPLSTTLTERQLKLFGKAAAAPPDSLLRKAVFEPGCFQARAHRGLKAVGRPRTIWTDYVQKDALSRGLATPIGAG